MTKTAQATLLAAFCLSACQSGGSDAESEAAAPPPLAEIPAEECVLQPPVDALACTMQFDPVCGCDGKTYGNACMARAAGVPRHESGACVERAD